MPTLSELLVAAVGHHRAGRLAQAEQLYLQVLQAQADQVDALHLLGLICHETGRRERSVELIRRALRLKPDFPDAHYNLGKALQDMGQFEEAAASYRQAVRLKPDYAEAHYNLGNVLRDSGRLDEAVASFQQAVRVKPDYAKAYNNLGSALQDQGKLADAVRCYRQAIQLGPKSAESAYLNLAIALHDQGNVDESLECYRRLMQIRPDQPMHELRIATECPTVFDSNEEIDRYRARFLADAEAFAGRDLRIDIAELSSIGCPPPFNLPFHGRNDRPLKEAYAGIFAKCLPAAERPSIRDSGLPRIGFVVTRKHERAFLKSMGGVVERMDPGLFELTVVCPNDSRETIRSGVRSPSVGILGFQGRFDQVVRTIRDARFDLLYFWEIGTDPTNYFLPFFRLAPVQCTSWGIQVTSGIPQMDYYLSSALVEPDDAADHYSEGLVLATTLLTWQERLSPPPSPKGREAFGIRPDRHVYLCAQHLGKFHPDFDPLLGAILRQDAEGLVVITEDQFGQAAPRLRSRLARTLPDVADRIVFLPFQGGADYLELIANADVLLDPLHFGGVNSTYDGLSLNKPIVTLPGQFHRARYTLGCYKKMGISECVASDAQQYVQIAVALGTDAGFRAEVVEKVRRSSPVLFEDLEAVREHQRLFRLLLDEARQAHSPQK